MKMINFPNRPVYPEMVLSPFISARSHIIAALNKFVYDTVDL
jgi:hypothetical protein